MYIGASNDLEAQAYTPIILSPRLETPLVFDDYQSFERPRAHLRTRAQLLRAREKHGQQLRARNSILN